MARGSKKGPRSPHRLNTLRSRVGPFLKEMQDRGINKAEDCKEPQLHEIIAAITKGLKCPADVVKDIKSFWHWLMLTMRKEYHATDGKAGALVDDITQDLDTQKKENGFCYFTLQDLEKMQPFFSEDEQVMFLFMFDTVIRTGKELSNVKASDIYGEELTIRDETSKTFGRTIKLLICKDALHAYIKRKKLKDDDYLFDYSGPYLNRKLKKVAVQVFGDKMTKGGNKFSEIVLYDFRHSGACHWRQGAYKSKIDALMYRGGWNNLKMLNYYTKKIGMSDSIEKSDLIVEADLNELQKLRQENEDIKKKWDQVYKALIAKKIIQG